MRLHGYPSVNAQWAFERTPGGLPAFYYGGCNIVNTTPATPILVPRTSIDFNNLRSPAINVTPNLQTQIRLQTQQIDSAIQLLKMQYDSIMTSLQMSEYNQPHRPSLLPNSQESRATTQQMTFDAQFDLSGAELFGERASSAISRAPTASACLTRGRDAATLRIMTPAPGAEKSAAAVDRKSSSSCRPPSPQPAKRTRFQ